MTKANRAVAFVILGLSGCLSINQASAALYSYAYVAEQDTYTSVPGNSDLVIPLYLQETNNTTGSTSSFLVDEQGLFQGGVSVSYTSGDAATVISNVIANPAFDTPIDVQNSGTSAVVWEAAFGTPVTAGAQSNGVSRVLLGTLTVHTSVVPNQTTVFTVSSYDPSSGTTFSSLNMYDLDNNLNPGNPAVPDAAATYDSAQGTFLSVTTAIPEPISMLSVSMGLLLPLMLRPRRHLTRN